MGGSADQAKPTTAERLWTLSFVLILIVSFLGAINGNGANNAVTMTVSAYGGSTSLAGIIVGVFCFAALVGRFISGTLSDRYGRKKIILVGCALLIVGCAIGMLPGPAVILLPCRVFMAFGFAMVSTATGAAVADIVPKSRVGEGVGYQSLGYALANAVGPGIAVNMAVYGRTILFGVFGALCVLALVFTFLCRFRNQQVDKSEPARSAESGQGGNAVGSVLSRFLERKAVGPAIVMALACMPLCIYMSFVSVYTAREAIAGATAFFVVAAVMMIVVRGFAAKLFDRLAPNTLFIPSCLLAAAGFALLILSHTTVALIAAGVVYGLAQGVIMPLLISQGIKRAPATRYGAASATMYIGCDGGIGIGSIVWGATISAFGFTATFAIGIAVLLIAAVAALFVFRRPVKQA